jgi:DNA-binding IclR family transcriptional regulator
VALHRDGIGLADLSKRVGLHNSTAFHLAKTMVSLGYLRQEKDSKRYRVGRPLFALAASALDEIEMVNVATPALEEMSRETGETSHFSVRMGDAVVVIARTGGPGVFQLTDRVGVVRPAHCTALGKVMLAALRDDQLKGFLDRADLKPSTPKSITDKSALMREIAEVRRTGIAYDDGEFQYRGTVRRRAGEGFHRAGHRRAQHFRPDLTPVASSVAIARPHRAGGRRASVRHVRREPR